MKRLLLIGAGFSRNWNGWLANELIGDLLGRLQKSPVVANELRRSQNFEETLAKYQAEAETRGKSEGLDAMQVAIRASFEEMNRSFTKLTTMEFASADGKTLPSFLGKFDAIFTLNQDLLLELNYKPLRHSFYFPGVGLPPQWQNLPSHQQLSAIWNVEEEFKLVRNAQPIFKLHGSVNWRDNKDRELMVMGAGKSNTIQKFPILQWYFTQFREMLTAGDTKIMVIGYGFGDQHINDELVAASKNHDLAMYLVDPAGLRPFDPPPNQLDGRKIRFPEFCFIGVATRPFRDAFWGDELQYSSLMRFFDN